MAGRPVGLAMRAPEIAVINDHDRSPGVVMKDRCALPAKAEHHDDIKGFPAVRAVIRKGSQPDLFSRFKETLAKRQSPLESITGVDPPEHQRLWIITPAKSLWEPRTASQLEPVPRVASFGLAPPLPMSHLKPFTPML
ncbi:hypothetical protein D3C80_1397670 [compost metagenome]